MPPAHQGPFRQELESVSQQLRGALAAAFAQCQVAPLRPQHIARVLGLDKSLAWKLANLSNFTHAAEAVRFLPGASGLEIALKALEKAGARAEQLDAIRSAWAAFRRLEKSHAGDRATLEVMAEGITSDPGRDAAVRARKQAFQGTSGIWGVQCATRLACYALAPSTSDPNRVDVGLIGGLIGLRRLRPEIGVPLFMLQSYRDNDAPPPQFELVDPKSPHPDLALISEFCSPTLPDLVANERQGGVRVELAPGPVGTTAQLTIVFGRLSRGFGTIHATQPGDVGEHPTRNFIPAELLLCDLYAHRELTFAHHPRAVLYSRLAGGPDYPWSGRDCDQLPVRERVIPIGDYPPTVVHPAIPNYPAMVERLFATGGWSLHDFRGFRFVLRYPPVPTILVLRYDLLPPASHPPDARPAGYTHDAGT